MNVVPKVVKSQYRQIKGVAAKFNQIQREHGFCTSCVNQGRVKDFVKTTFPDQSMLGNVYVPPLSLCKHFINLTNGVEALPILTQLNLPYSFVRIQSTFCEQRRWDQLLGELDPTLLINLALGHCCLVYDYGSRNKKRAVPRAVWYGLEFIRFTLNYLWLGTVTDSYLRGPKVNNVFTSYVNNLDPKTTKKLMYYQRYIASDLTGVKLYGVYQSTENDHDMEYYRKIVQKHCSPDEVWFTGDETKQLLDQFNLKLFLGGVGHRDIKTLFED